MPSSQLSVRGAAAQYDRFADIYDIWTETAPAAQSNRGFYVEAYLAAGGPVVELGVGDGRIAVEAAARGCRVIGVDVSPVMLRRCRKRAEEAGVGDRIELLESDFRTFRLDDAAAPAAVFPNGDDRRLIEHNAMATRIDKGIGGAKVDRQVIRKITQEVLEHAEEGPRRS